MLVYSVLCFQLDTLDLQAHPSQHCMKCIVRCTTRKVSDTSSDIVPTNDKKPFCAATTCTPLALKKRYWMFGQRVHSETLALKQMHC